MSVRACAKTLKIWDLFDPDSNILLIDRDCLDSCLEDCEDEEVACYNTCLERCACNVER